MEIEIEVPKPPSLNQYYAGRHWAIRKKQKDDYKKYCKEKLEEYDAFCCDTYELTIRYNARHDVDNVVLVSKFFSDTLVDMDIVKDDGNKYYKKLTIKIDKELPKNIFYVKAKFDGCKELL